MKFTNKQKSVLKGWAAAVFIFIAFGVVGSMDMQDAIDRNASNVISVTE